MARVTAMKVPVVVDPGEVSDGYHTFNELYLHRMALMAALMRFSGAPCWRSRQHHDGTMFKGFFIIGMTLGIAEPNQITYHIEEKHWEEFAFAPTLEHAPDFDGHTASDAVRRLLDWSLLGVPNHRPEVLCYLCGRPVSLIDRNGANSRHPRCQVDQKPTDG